MYSFCFFSLLFIVKVIYVDCVSFGSLIFHGCIVFQGLNIEQYDGHEYALFRSSFKEVLVPGAVSVVSS